MEQIQIQIFLQLFFGHFHAIIRETLVDGMQERLSQLYNLKLPPGKKNPNFYIHCS